MDVIRESISQGLAINDERLPEVRQYRCIINDIASAVLKENEPAFPDSDVSDGGDCASLSDLTLVS